MAFLYVSEYSTFGLDPNTSQGLGKEPSFDQAPVAISATAASSQPFQPSTKLVRLSTDSTCSICFGGVAATVNNKRLASNQTEYFATRAGDSVSVIANS